MSCAEQSCCAPTIFTTITPPTPTPAAISLSIITDITTGYPTLTWDIEDADVWRDSILIQSNTASPYTDTSAVSGQSYEYQTKSGIDSSNVVKAQIPGLADMQSAPLPVVSIDLASLLGEKPTFETASVPIDVGLRLHVLLCVWRC